MKRILSPTAQGEPATVAALVVAVILGVLLASTVDIGPPDYALPLEWPGAKITELTGIETEDGSGVTARYSSWSVRLATDDMVQIAVAWSDHELFAPAGHTVLVDRVHRCVRILITATGSVLTPQAAEELAVAQTGPLDAYIDESPRDPCLGRPGSV